MKGEGLVWLHHGLGRSCRRALFQPCGACLLGRVFISLVHDAVSISLCILLAAWARRGAHKRARRGAHKRSLG